MAQHIKHVSYSSKDLGPAVTQIQDLWENW